MEFMNIATFIWLFIIVAAAVFEAMSPSFFAISFSIAAIPALVLSLLGVGPGIQFFIFVIALALVLFYLLPAVRKLSKINVDHANEKYVKTNLDLIIGEKANVLADIAYLKDGLVKVDGKEWTAKTEDKDKVFKTGDIVTIKAIKGSKVEVV